MRLDYYLPSPACQSVLSIHATAHEIGQTRIETLPAMLPNLHIRLSGRSSFIPAHGKRISAPAVALIGPTSASYCVELEPGCRLAVVGLLPAGWASLPALSDIDCTDQVLDGADIWGPALVSTLLDRVRSRPLDGKHIPAIEAFLLRMLRPPSHTRQQQVAAIDHWLERSAELRLDELCGHLGVGARQLRRLTLAGHGLSPKQLEMKYRALRTAALICQASPAVQADLTRQLQAYADQPHLIRDFRRFIGWTPAAFLRESHNIAAATLNGRRLAGATRPLVLLS